MTKKEIKELIKTEIEAQIKVLLQNELEKIKKELKQQVKSKDSILKIKKVLIDTTKLPENPFKIIAKNNNNYVFLLKNSSQACQK